MTYRQACDLLGVRPGTSADETKKAYRRLAREHHPDRNPDDPSAVDRFRRVQEAFDLLRATAFELRPASPEVSPPPSTAVGDSPTEVADWPGGRVPWAVPRNGPDVLGHLRLSLAEVFEGCTADISFPDEIGCDRCGATGGEPGSFLMRCPGCSGLGGDCVWCSGAGETPDQPCGVCRGKGLIAAERSVRVQVPRSAHDGEELVLANKAKWGLEERGHLRLRLRVDEPQHIRRVDDDLEVDTNIGVLEAVFGGHAHVDTIDGLRHTINVRPGTSSGRRLRIRGGGMFRDESGTERGDLYAVIQIDVPAESDLSERQRYLYLQLLDEERMRADAEDLQVV